MKKTPIYLIVVLLIACLPSNLWALGMEDFGNAPPLNEGNYRDWPNIMPLVNDSSRIYHWWVNGNEQFYYRGDTKAVNDALKKFAAVTTEVHEILLQPGPGTTHSFNAAKTIPYNWNLHIVGGVVRHMTKLDQGDKIWSKSPMLTVCVGGEIDLTKVEIPDGVSVVSLTDLSRRYREALVSKDKMVRASAVGRLANLDPYNTDNLAAIAILLKDEDNEVRRNAAWAVASFGKKAEPMLPVLREMLNTENEQFKATVEKTTEKIEQADDTAAAEQEYRSIQEKIHAFCDSRKR